MKNIFRISSVIKLILLIIFIHSCRKDDDNTIKDGDQNVDRKIYEGKLFEFVNGSKPGMPIRDNNKNIFVPQANDTREIMVIDQTFSVAAGQNYLIENKIVYVRPTARSDINIFGTLKIRNSFLSWQQTEHQQTRFRIKQGGILDIKDSYSFWGSQYWVNWDYENGSTIILDNFVGDPWTSMSGSVNYTSKNFSTVYLTFLSNVFNSNVNITDAHNLYLEIYPPENSTFDITFPEKRKWVDWTLNNIWNNTNVNITTSYLLDRDLGISNGTKATVRDTPSGFGLGWAIYYYGGPYDFITCEISELGDPDNNKGKFYTDRTWEIPSNNSSLHIINSTLLKAWPVTWGQVHLIVKNSNLADPRIFSGSGTYEIYNSTIDHFAAYSGTKAYLENCRIRNDIEIKDYNTIVYGFNVTKIDNNDFSIMELNGGRYQVLNSPGIPWPFLYISTNILSIAAANCTKTFEIKSNTNWSVVSNQSWLTVSSGTGTNNSTISLTVTANPTGSPRSAIITVTVTGVTIQKLTINQEAVTTGINEISNNSVSLFPNPVTNELTINNIRKNSIIAIYDLNGRLLINKIAKSPIEKIDVSSLSNGVYLIKVTDKKTNKTNKFVKQ